MNASKERAGVRLCAAVFGLLVGTAAADVFNMGGTFNPVTGTWTGLASLDTVTVGEPGNAADTRAMNDGTTGYGTVGYTYQMGKFDVTAGQYTAFLNAVAKTDTYGLYSTYMANTTSYGGCNIQRSGTAGSYSYAVPGDWANRPVNFVSWGDAARLANWLSNGQPTGEQNASTTEDGSYVLNGATTISALATVTRKHDATWVIPSEDEWYKAAYYDPDKPGGAGYWNYPTRNDTPPSNVLSTTGANNANYSNNGNYTIGSPYLRTEVGAFAASPSAYGTYDQGGNVWQWNEAVFSTIAEGRGLRGGSCYNSGGYMNASSRIYGYSPTHEHTGTGFRLALVPEPATILMAALSSVGVLPRLRRKPSLEQYCSRRTRRS